MNKGIYRLVYNKARAAWVAAGEHVRSHAPGNTGSKARLARRQLLVVLFMAIPTAHAGKLAPDTVPTGLTVKVGPHTTINAAVTNPANGAGKLVKINQADTKAIIQGSNFNIGKASAVQFDHTGGAGSATLVRISGDKSIIEGSLTSLKGDIYLINQNGILFADGARVNVHGLVASALDLEDNDFLNDLGHLYPNTVDRAAYVWKGDADGFSTALVQVEPDARIKAQLGGSVMLFAPKVLNQGSIETDQGQVVMAAGSKVYLSYAPDPNSAEGATSFYSYAPDSPYRSLAGVLVEVDPYQEKSGGAVTKEITGSAVNDTMGRILAKRGNVTMASFLVNQSGRITATASVSQKGSIRLLARDNKISFSTEAFDENGAALPQNIISGGRTGDLVLGAKSVTAVLPEHVAGAALAKNLLTPVQSGEPKPSATDEKSYLGSVLDALKSDGATVTDEQIFNPPTLEAVGRNVTMQDGAKVVVPGGHISMTAQGLDVGGIIPATGRLYLGKDTLIDASGLDGVQESLDSNFIEVLLTLNDLKDDPLNKNGFLYRKKVWFDIRDLPDNRVADLSGYLKQVPRDIGEKLATGGTVKLQSDGELVQRAGSRIDVSGGSLRYGAGVHKETWLVDLTGKSYALGSAPADTVFTGFLGASNLISSREDGYTEGAAAGTLSMGAFSMALDGTLAGGATYGEHQRSSSNLGGSLIMGITGQSGRDANYGLPAIDIVASVTPLAASSNETDALPTQRAQTVQLDAGMLNRSGFEKMAMYANGNVSVDAALHLKDGAALSITGRSVNINDDIVARGGSVSLNSRLSLNDENFSTTGVTVDKGVKLDVSGQWINDYLAGRPGTGRLLTKGGSIAISSAGDVSLGAGSLLDVSGGGWAQVNGKVKGGDAGGISIVSQLGQQTGEYRYVAPVLKGELRGYALGRGGSLSITAPFITLGQSGSGDSRELLATPAFFQNGGFTSFSLTGRDGVLVKAGTHVDVMSRQYQLRNNFLGYGNGSHLADFSDRVLLPSWLRNSTSLTLGTQYAFSDAFLGVPRGAVVVEPDAFLRVDSNGNRKDSAGNLIAPAISLSAWNSELRVDGTLQALGGKISLTMNGDPTSASDEGYSASQVIWLGDEARLLAGGFTQMLQDASGLRKGTVYDGGSVNLTANKGYIVTEAGSVIDVSGTAATLDVLGRTSYTPTRIASNGGTVRIDAREGMLLDGGYRADSPGGLDGSLDLRLGRGQRTNVDVFSTYPGTAQNSPNQQWQLMLTQSGNFVSPTLQPGDSLKAQAQGSGKVAADSIEKGGFGTLALKSEYDVRFATDVDLGLSRSLSIDAQVIDAVAGVHVNLTAPVVSITDTDATMRPLAFAPVPVTGNATLDVNGRLIDLRGQFALSGFSQSSFTSSGDIRLTGYSASTDKPSGWLRGSGELDFKAAQIYPTSLSAFTISSEGAGGKVHFSGNGTSSPVWSAGGSLLVKADTIEQDGVLKAPFGSISLVAGTQLSLGAGSLTSVSAEGQTIPFGYTSRDGLDYLYDFGSGQAVLTAPPERSVNLTSPVISQQAGSMVDISGGGDLRAYEWVPGIGGSADVLAAGASLGAFGTGTTAAWAVMPAAKAPFATYDTQYWQGSGLKAGDAVYLSAGPGLAAGYYTLLPARYALLPGAYLVTAQQGTQDMSANAAVGRVDGSTLVSGHLAAYTAGGYVQTSRTAGFTVRSASAVRKLAEYQDSLASKRYTGQTQVQQVADAGRLSLAATSSLALEGTLRSIHAQTARGAEVDIAAPNLAVVAHGETAPTGYLALDADSLTALNASSLLLGGTRSATDGGEIVNVLSDVVQMSSNAGLQGPEVILAANKLVHMEAGSTLNGTGDGSSGRNLFIGNSDTGISGDGALLRASGGEAVAITRSNISRTRGDLVIDSGAVANADGALQLDSTRALNVAGSLGASGDTALNISAGRISLGTPDNGALITNGLNLSQLQLDNLSQAQSLTLHSYSTLDFYGAVGLGNSALDLTLAAAGIGGYQNAGLTANIVADKLTLTNVDDSAYANAPKLSNGAAPILGSGSLQVQAGTILNGQNNFQISGFSQTLLQSSGDIRATAVGSISAAGDLALSAGRITADKGADQTYTTTGALTILQNGTPALPVAKETAGARLAFSGASLLHQGTIDLPSGQVSFQATGPTGSHVVLDSGSRILAQGDLFTLSDSSVALPGGAVSLGSKNGNVELRSGALIDVSSAAGGDAGSLKVSAVNGVASLAGTLKAGTHGDDKGQRGKDADISVDAQSVDDFSRVLSAAGEFAGSQNYRIRQGNVTIASNDQVNTSRLTLTADAGSIDVSGKVDASGEKGGSVEMYASGNMMLHSGSTILAKGLGDRQAAGGSIGRGGSVVLSSSNGTISADGSATVNVAGDHAGSITGEDGSVLLRAGRTASGVLVDVTAPAAVSGASQVLIEAVKTYSTASIAPSLQTTLATDTKNYFAAALPGMSAFSQTQDGLSATLAAGIEIRSSATTLQLPADWDLSLTSAAMPAVGATILTLRSAGNLTLSGSLNYEQYTQPQNIPTLRNPSWSYRLAAGADMGSANPDAVVAGKGTLALAANKVVRTGAGFIHAEAGKDITLGSGSAIYTEGIPSTVGPSGFAYLVPNVLIYREVYPGQGGEVRLSAGGDITGQATDTQSVNSWLNRAALRPSVTTPLANPQVRWWPRYDLFKNGVGALGGGDVEINAGGAVSNLQFVSASNGRMGGSTASVADVANLMVQGGGDVAVKAGSSMQNALLFAARGDADARAGGTLDAQFALMGGSAAATAGGDVTISNVINPTSVRNPLSTSPTSVLSTYFYSYDEGDSLSATSASGNVNLASDAVYPGKLFAAAPAGDVTTANALTLYPSATGNLTLLAGHDVNARLVMSDADPALLPQASSQPRYDLSRMPVLTAYAGSSAHAADLLHATDDEPARIYAGNDVLFTQFEPVVLSKPVQVHAGNDVVDPNLIVQNLNAADVSQIEAGGAIRYTAPVPNPDGSIDATEAGIQVAGPGRLHLIAKGDIDLGSSDGVRSVGDLYNPYLSATGADLMVLPGSVGLPDYTAMIAAYIDPATSGANAGIYQPMLLAYMRDRTGDTNLTADQATTQFKSLDAMQQAQFVDTVFFRELRDGGRAASVSAGDYSRAERAILRMFPSFTSNHALATKPGNIMAEFQKIASESFNNPGDLKLFYSQIRSERGGRIELLVPGGFVNAGLAVSGALLKPATDLGIVSIRGGDIYGMVRSDLQVNQSRVFTLGGSDLMLYSALADIDAGRGAKTSSATPPPVLRVKDGQVYYDYSGAVSGSGIAALTATGGQPGTVDLYAPYGEINAGEAGIRSAGNINLGAHLVVGADNIQAGGGVSGVASADTSGLSLSVGGVSDAASNNKSSDQAGQSQQSASRLASAQDSFMPSFVSVEVIGLGNDTSGDEKDTRKEKSAQ